MESVRKSTRPAHTPLRPPGLHSLSPGDPGGLPAASPRQPAPGIVRSVVPKPSFLHLADTASGPSYPPPPLQAPVMWPHFAHLDSNIHPQLPACRPLGGSGTGPAHPHIWASLCHQFPQPAMFSSPSCQPPRPPPCSRPSPVRSHPVTHPGQRRLCHFALLCSSAGSIIPQG